MIKFPEDVISIDLLDNFMDNVKVVKYDDAINFIIDNILDFNKSSFITMNNLINITLGIRSLVNEYKPNINMSDIETITTFNIPVMLLELIYNLRNVKKNKNISLSTVLYLLFHIVNLLDIDLNKLYKLTNLPN